MFCRFVNCPLSILLTIALCTGAATAGTLKTHGIFWSNMVIQRDFYGRKVTGPIIPADLKQAYYTSAAKDAIALEFDQPVVWKDSPVNEFRLDGAKGNVTSGAVSGNVLTLELKEPVQARKITYPDEMAWSQDRLLIGKNGLAVLTFCNVPVLDERNTK